MKKIKLTTGQNVLVDDEDFPILSKYRWNLASGYARRWLGKNTHMFMHRQIMGTPKGMETDHINHNRLDNRKKNLRICTSQQNKFNMPKSPKNTSGYKWVTWAKTKGKWQGSFKFNGHTHFVGLYNDSRIAHNRVKQAVEKVHKEFLKT